MRYFFALWPDAETAARIAHAAADVSAAILQQIGAQQRAVRCTLTFDGYEHWANARALVAVARDTPAALFDLSVRLRRDIASHPATLPLQRIEGALRPHVTLARKVTQATVPQAMSPFDWTASTFSLMRSERSGMGSVYTVVDTWPLLDEIAAR